MTVTYLQDHVVTLMVFVFVGTFVALLLAPLWSHMRVERRRRKRIGWYSR